MWTGVFTALLSLKRQQTPHFTYEGPGGSIRDSQFSLTLMLTEDSKELLFVWLFSTDTNIYPYSKLTLWKPLMNSFKRTV